MTKLHDLAEQGQSAWVDFLSRPFVRDGELERLVAEGVSGLTSNPTIFAKAIAAGDYDDQLGDLFARETGDKDAFLAVAASDIQQACDILRPVFDRGDSSRDGWVSLEVDPRLADDTAGTIDEAQHLHQLIDRPNLFVKIPGTEAGIPAIEECIVHGIPINVTLLFSLDRHRQAAEAYLRGLQRRLAAGEDLSGVASVASFFVSRVDAEADGRLQHIVEGSDLVATLAIANAKLAYQTYVELFTGPTWDVLAAAGGSPQRCLWASTSTKDPAMRDVRYVEALIGNDTVTTMPTDTVAAFQDHGDVASTLAKGVSEARQTMDLWAQTGIDYADVTRVLEEEGVQKFAESFEELLETVANKRDEIA